MRDTVGKISTELLKKEPDTRSPIELEREMHKEYEQNIWECVDLGKKEYPSDFFVVVITKKERLMQNVIRNYFFSRLTCPTPDYDQTVYQYMRKDDALDFLWVIPSQDTCQLFMQNALQIHPDEKWLLQFILDFADGSLFKLAKKLNKEISLESPLIKKD